MKKVKSLNGYSIFEAGPRDVDKYGYEAGSFFVFFSSDIRDFGIANSSPEYDGLDTLEAAEACCLGNYAKAREIVEGSTTAASFEEIAEVERQLDNGEIADDGEPEETSCEAVIEAVKNAGYTTVVLRPLMVVAGDHANNDMAGADDDSWKTMFEAAGFTVNCQISGLGRIADVQALYVAHTKAAIDAIA